MKHAPPLTEFQRELVDHWIKYMPIHYDHIMHAIRCHFEAAPWDVDAMKPWLDAAWTKLKKEKS